MAAISRFIYGTDGNDELMLDFGLIGTLVGLFGDDVYVIHSEGFLIVEQAAGGIDTVKTGLQVLELPGNVENLIFLSGGPAMDGPVYYMGNALANVIQGGSSDDELDGGAGNDTMIGGLGGDTYYVDSAGDKVIEELDPFLPGLGGPAPRDTVIARVSYVLPANVEDLFLWGESLNGTGNGLDNYIEGYGNGTLQGLAGDDVLVGYGSGSLLGGDGNDELHVFGGENYVLDGGAGDDSLHGSQDGRGTLRGGAGADRLYAGSGSDTLAGNAGDDTFYLIDLTATIVELPGQGSDTVLTDAQAYTMPANVEVLRYVGMTSATLTGNAGNNWMYGGGAIDTLIGMAGNDYLDGGSSRDRMEGGTGNDSYMVDAAGDVVVELAGAGTDTVYAEVPYTLPENVENLALVAAGSATGIGNALGNVITGGAGANRLEGRAGNDTLDGGAGDDTLVGGGGDDTFVLDSFNDRAVELAGEGTDTVLLAMPFSQFDVYWLPAHVENLQVQAPDAWFYFARLMGNDSDNRIVGSAGPETLDGGLGADRMAGGASSDSYYVDQAGDLVVEAAGEGYDEVFASIDYALPANVEHLTLVGGAAMGTGNALANGIVGNAFGNTLTGGAGEDELYGNGGGDTLNGGDGNDFLDGGSGDDRMTGGAGNDSYLVDATGDSVLEAAGGGTDEILSSVYSIVLPGQVENLELLWQSLATIGYGNSLSNTITGNARNNILGGFEGNDWLDGGPGNDDMAGNGGDDTYVVDAAGDVVHESTGEGKDTIRSNVSLDLSVFAPQVEDLVLLGDGGGYAYGNALANVLNGDDSSNVLRGAEGNDRLVGNGGNDTLDGESGADTMIGGTGNDAYTVANIGDVVTELPNQGLDRVDVYIPGYTLSANVENAELVDTSGALTGNALDNRLDAGRAGSTILDGAAGNDSLFGSPGVDTLSGGAGNDLIGGRAGNDTLYGGPGNDVLDGFDGMQDTYAGNDTMRGGPGDDFYFVDTGDGAGPSAGASEDQVIELAGEGSDTVHVINRPVYVLPANVENVGFGGATAFVFTGNELANRLTLSAAAPGSAYALGGDDTFELFVPNGAPTQAQVLDGGAGTDRLDVQLYAATLSLSTSSIERVGFDVNAPATVTTAGSMSGVTEVTVSGSADLTLPAIGGPAAGTAPRYVFDQYAGKAALAVAGATGNGSDVLNVELNGAALNLQVARVETLIFDSIGSGNAVKLDLVTGLPDVEVNGSATFGITGGIASMDTLTVENFTGARFYLSANSPVGVQTVNLALSGTVATEFDVIGLGSDTDTININALTGSASHLRLSGESLDAFNLTGAGSVVLEMVNAGAFTASSFSGYLRATFDSAASFSVSGAANGRYDLTGSNTGDTFRLGTSLDGLDRIDGGSGLDSLVADITGLTLATGALHLQSIESATLTANATTAIDAGDMGWQQVTVNGSGSLTVVNAYGTWNASDLSGPLNLTALYHVDVTGSKAGDTIAATAWNADTLNGRGGNDTLAGGAGGYDTFVFNTALGPTNVDTILDFEAGDKIQLENLIFGALSVTGSLAAGNFFSGAGVTDTSGADVNDFVKYDTASGNLYYDSNGSAAAGMTLFAVVNFGPEHPTLGNSDFTVI